MFRKVYLKKKQQNDENKLWPATESITFAVDEAFHIFHHAALFIYVTLHY